MNEELFPPTLFSERLYTELVLLPPKMSGGIH